MTSPLLPNSTNEAEDPLLDGPFFLLISSPNSFGSSLDMELLTEIMISDQLSGSDDNIAISFTLVMTSDLLKVNPNIGQLTQYSHVLIYVISDTEPPSFIVKLNKVSCR